MANDYFFDGYRMTKYYDDYLGGHTEDFDFWPACLSGREKILEIACGTGRITIPLLKLGKRITALDYSSEMLELLYRKTEAYRDQLTIVNGDMRNYKLNQRFDAVIITANSVNHLENPWDLEKTLKCAAEHLFVGGLLIFDALHPELHHLLRDKQHQYDHDEFIVQKTGEKITVYENSEYDRKTQTSSVDYYYTDESGETKVLSIKNHFFFPQELDYIVSKSDFDVLRKLGTYTGEEFTSESKEQIYILKKKA